MRLTIDEFLALHIIDPEPVAGILVCNCGLWRSNVNEESFARHLVVEAYKQY